MPMSTSKRDEGDADPLSSSHHDTPRGTKVEGKFLISSVGRTPILPCNIKSNPGTAPSHGLRQFRNANTVCDGAEPGR